MLLSITYNTLSSSLCQINVAAKQQKTAILKQGSGEELFHGASLQKLTPTVKENPA